MVTVKERLATIETKLDILSTQFTNHLRHHESMKVRKIDWVLTGLILVVGVIGLVN